MTITLDPIEVPRMNDEDLAHEDERQRALAELDRLANPEQLHGIRVPAPPGQPQRAPGGTVYPPGTVPPRDPVTAARGEADITGEWGRIPSPPMDPGTRGAVERTATPRPELLAAIRQRRGQQPGAAAALANPTAPTPPTPQATAGATPSASSGVAPAGPAPAPDRNARLLQLINARREGHDYTGEDVADAIARPFRAIGAGLMAASGRTPQHRPSFRERAEARDRQGDMDALRAAQAQDQIAGHEADRNLAARRVGVMEQNAETLAGSREANAAIQQERERRMADVAQRRLELQAQGMEPTAALRQAQLEQIQAHVAERRAMQDPESEASQRARERFTRELSFLSEASGQRYDISPEGMSAADIEALERRLGVPRHVRQRASRGGGGGTLARPEWFTGTDQEWSALGATGRRSAILRHSQRSGSEEEAFPEVILGSGIRFGGDVDATTQRATRSALEEARGHMAALGTIDRIARERGPQAAVDPRTEADLVASTQAMMAMVAQMRNTGIINPGEAPTIEAAIPNPRSLRQMTLGEVQRRVRSFRDLLEQRIQARLGVLGVADADQQRVIRWLRSGSLGGGGSRAAQPAAPAGGPQDEMVPVTNPNGEDGYLPRRLIDRARQRGWTVRDGS